MKRLLRQLHDHLRAGFVSLAWYGGHLGQIGGNWWTALGRFGRGPRGRALLRGLPAVVIGAGAVSVAALAIDQRDELTDVYAAAVHDALRAQDYDRGRIAAERLSLLDGGQPETRFRLALAYQGLGETDRAAAVMAGIASFKAAGYPAAHVWLAGRLLARPARDNASLAQQHLLRAVELDPDHTDAHLLLGRLFLESGHPELARQHLLIAVRGRPEVGLILATVYRQLGQEEQWRHWAERSRRYYETYLETHPASLAARHNLAEARAVLGDHAGAVELLEQGGSVIRDGAHRARLVRAYSDWINTLPADAVERRLALAERGLQYDPANVQLVKVLVDLRRGQGPTADRARARVDQLLNADKGVATVHFLVGMEAFDQGKKDVARRHLETVCRLDPTAATAANNLAWLLANTDPPDLPRALELANAALAKNSANAHFRETRGQIYVKLGRWREALTDLEAALPVLAQDPGLHRSLAETYRRLGLPEMAAEHQKLAEAKK